MAKLTTGIKHSIVDFGRGVCESPRRPLGVGYARYGGAFRRTPSSPLWDLHRIPLRSKRNKFKLFPSGFSQISLGSHRNPGYSLWDSHRISERIQNKFELLPPGFTQISLGSHTNPLSTLWDSHSYPWNHRNIKIRALLHGIHTDIPGLTQNPALLYLGLTQISLRSQKNKCELFTSGIQIDIPGLA